MKTPNLFSFATSELSQDAAIAYFLSWADEEYREVDLAMHTFGRRFLHRLLDKHSKVLPEAVRVEVNKQSGNIDLLVKITHQGGIMVLIVEDKTFSKAENPFEEYIKYANEKYEVTPIGILLSLGNQVRTSPTDDFQLFTRKDLVECFRGEPGEKMMVATDQIFVQFNAHIVAHHRAYNTFENEGSNANEWRDQAWEGFFEHLVSLPDLPFHGYRYVSNKSGGLIACWCKPDERLSFEGVPVYLQLEYTGKPVPSSNRKDKQCLLTFKMGEVPEKNRDAALTKAFFESIQTAAIPAAYRTRLHPGHAMANHNIREIIKRPLTLRTGEFTTAAIIQQSDWFTDPMNYESAIKKLLEFQRFLVSIPKVKVQK